MKFQTSADTRLADLASALFADLGTPAERSYRCRDGYHILDIDREKRFRAFESAAPAVLDAIMAELPALADRLAETIARRQTHLLNSIREGVWIVAHATDLMVDCRLSKPHRDLIVASPGFALFKNMDRVPLRIRLFSCVESFEIDPAIDLGSTECVTLAPGEIFVLDGFRQIATMEDSGVLVAGMVTLPLGAYDSVYSLEDGRRIGLVSSELRSSALAVVLRLFAAAGWQGAEAVMPAAENSAIRELRWSAMNYAWRADLPELEARMARFAADPDPDISRIAAACLASLTGANAMGAVA